MPSRNFVKGVAGGCTMDIDVTPGATQTAITGVNEWRGTLQIRIAAAPERGRANEELVRFLSDMFDVGRSEIVVLKGMLSHHKRVFIPLPPEDVLKRVGRCR